MKRSIELFLYFLGIFLSLVFFIGIVYNVQSIINLIMILSFHSAILFAVLASDLLFKKEKKKQMKKQIRLKVKYQFINSKGYFTYIFKSDNNLKHCVEDAIAFAKEHLCTIAEMTLLTTEE